MMNDNASVTITMKEYRQLTSGMPLAGGGLLLIVVITFLVGLLVGMTTTDDPKKAPAPRPTVTARVSP